ncbi:MAG: MerR family transcriptional regulator [Acidobacteriota bacterium]
MKRRDQSSRSKEDPSREDPSRDDLNRDDRQYSIGELAELGGVSRRTVRYYVQRGLLTAPAGGGRGSHYTQQHLDTLIRIRRLQEAGRPLSEITTRLTGRRPPEPAMPPPEVRYSSWTRIALGDGIELHLRDTRVDSDQVRKLGQAIAEILEKGNEP